MACITRPTGVLPAQDKVTARVVFGQGDNGGRFVLKREGASGLSR